MGTDGIGICKAGLKTCDGEGLHYGECIGDVQPATENCLTPADEDCDGQDCVMWGRLFGDISNQSVTDVAADQHDQRRHTGSAVSGRPCWIACSMPVASTDARKRGC